MDNIIFSLIYEFKKHITSEQLYNIIHIVKIRHTLSPFLYNSTFSDVSLSCFGLTPKQAERVRFIISFSTAFFDVPKPVND
jgi:hypothetical protein